MLYIKGNLSREETTQDLLAVFPEAMVAFGEAKGRRDERRATSSLDDYAAARMALGEARGSALYSIR